MEEQPHKPELPPQALAPSCPKCAAGMEQGFLLDRGYGKMYQASWIAGEPDKSFWNMNGIASSSQLRERVNIVTFRCPACGFLESYAPLDHRTSD